jgi:predicted nucleic-acid-binding protein
MTGIPPSRRRLQRLEDGLGRECAGAPHHPGRPQAVAQGQLADWIDALDDTSRGFVSLVSVAGLVWLLSSADDLSREQVTQTLDVMLRTTRFAVEQSEQVLRAVRVFAAGKADFTDRLIERLSAQAGCEKTRRFDAGAAMHAGMTPIA